jgi:large subunit ribosomal protein L9
MKVILTENIDKVGVKGDVINVKRGFARNYLVPRNFAIYATPINVKKLDSLKQQFAKEESKQLEQLKKIGEQISALKLSFTRKVDEHENLYGSVSEIDIQHELKEKGIDIPKAAILMDKHVKQLGEFEVAIRLHKDVNVTVRGTVLKEGAELGAVEKVIVAEPVVEEIAEPVIEEEAVIETEPIVEDLPATEETVEEKILADEAEAEEEKLDKASE